jgi:hypothetical protein
MMVRLKGRDRKCIRNSGGEISRKLVTWNTKKEIGGRRGEHQKNDHGDNNNILNHGKMGFNGGKWRGLV